MTGYAIVHGSDPSLPASPQENHGWALEVRSVNSRFLDVIVKLPDECRQLEPKLREAVRSHGARAKVELRLAWANAPRTERLEPSNLALTTIAQAQRAVLSAFPDATPLNVAEVISLASRAEGATLPDEGAIMLAATTALGRWRAARQTEGEKLCVLLNERVLLLRQLVGEAMTMVPKQVELQRERFLQRWRDALNIVQSDPTPDHVHERALVECAGFASRVDVAEEIGRLDSHLVEIARLLNAGGELGKRLDFLIQELHREANTLGSKSASLEMTRISVDMKVLIEQMREQVQNIE